MNTETRTDGKIAAGKSPEADRASRRRNAAARRFVRGRAETPTSRGVSGRGTAERERLAPPFFVLWTFPDYFENGRRERERGKLAEQGSADTARRREIEAEKRKARAAHEREADYFSRQPLVETCNRRGGTAKGLAEERDTPAGRENSRRKHGKKRNRSGSVIRYEPTRSANRCAMERSEADDRWTEIADNPAHRRAWTEIEAGKRQRSPQHTSATRATAAFADHARRGRGVMAKDRKRRGLRADF